eukprot:CAMPEP_0184710454 /NCGR_PEP_ID=MMETSP0314-20130426/1249_1 /TAXON_ID=38298 /ORGANISM="Rhodella maculata, Strain CCMP 736" /LENGTH=35 /DNA_ID= /DNA_START= /DNA_END= /DNA_ORIENTATION=
MGDDGEGERIAWNYDGMVRRAGGAEGAWGGGKGSR